MPRGCRGTLPTAPTRNSTASAQPPNHFHTPRSSRRGQHIASAPPCCLSQGSWRAGRGKSWGLSFIYSFSVPWLRTKTRWDRAQERAGDALQACRRPELRTGQGTHLFSHPQQAGISLLLFFFPFLFLILFWFHFLILYSSPPLPPSRHPMLLPKAFS